jgi:hypothetical protein
MRSIGLAIPLLFSQLCFCQMSHDQPSLEVTMNWLSTNLRSAKSEVATETISFDKDGKPKKKIKKDTIYATILIAQANGCDLTITTQVRWNLDLAKTSVETIPLGKVTVSMGDYTRVNPDKDTKMTFNPPSVIHLYLTAPSALIRDSITSHLIDNSVADTTTIAPSSRTAVELDDAQLAPRLFKALEHASQLCHTVPDKPEPF